MQWTFKPVEATIKVGTGETETSQAESHAMLRVYFWGRYLSVTSHS